MLTSFIALVGMRGPGMEFKEIYDTMMKPSREGDEQSVGCRKEPPQRGGA